MVGFESCTPDMLFYGLAEPSPSWWVGFVGFCPVIKLAESVERFRTEEASH